MSTKQVPPSTSAAGAGHLGLEWERLFAAFMEHFPGGAWIKDLEGRFLFSNGQTPAGAPWVGQSSDPEVLRGGQAVQALETLAQQDGPHQVLVTRFPLRDGAGRPAWIGGVGVDVTELARTKAALLESEDRWRSLVELSPDAILVQADGRFVYANPSAVRLFGAPSAAALLARDVLDTVHPDFRAGVAARIVQAQTAGGSRPAFLEARILQFDGQAVDVESCATAVIFEGRPAIQVILHEIRERKRVEAAVRQSEAEARALLNATTETVLLLDRAGTILAANDTAAQRLGASPATLLGKCVYGLLPADVAATRAASADRVLRTGQPLRFTDVRGGRTLDTTVYPVLDAGNRVTQLAVFANDITERVQAEEKLKLNAQQLQSLSQQLVEAQENERRHLARELHDEIGQALTVIQLHLQAALGRGEGAIDPTHLQASLTQVRELVRKTQDLSLSLRPSLLDDLGLPTALDWYARQQASRAGLRIAFWSAPLERRLDPALETACFRVAQEAITNVIRHAQAREVTLHLECESAALHLSVHDDGRGFDPPAVLGGRTSLGLLGMQERVALVGGRFACHSSPRHGTAVHAWFPLRWRDAARPPSPGQNSL